MVRKIVFVIWVLLLISCQNFDSQKEKETINQTLDAWHSAAATADEDIFFGTFTQDGIYIGTDPTEYWTAKELEEWSKPFFEKESAWDFKPYDRHIYFSEDGNTAWFDELLKTWMGTCRGSGVVIKTEQGWKLKHYHLSIAVPNEVTQDYLKLLKPKNP